MDALTLILTLVVGVVGAILHREQKEGNRKAQEELRKRVSEARKEEAVEIIKEIRKETEGPTPEQDLADRLNQ